MLIDMHIHEKRNSDDSHQYLEEIVKEAKKIGLDAICITDHESMGLKEFADSYSKEVDFPIFVGAEYLTKEGDILAFGIDKLPSEMLLTAQEFIDYVNSKGGVTIAAHPYRNNNRGLGDNLYKLRGLSGIEVLNGSTSMIGNLQALEACKNLGLTATGASDSHHIGAIGKYVTRFDSPIYTMEDLVSAIKKGQAYPEILQSQSLAHSN